MITFIHLSDIHFTDRDSSTQFDRDRKVRSALLDDLEGKPAGQSDYDGVLITGDIAFGGIKAQYDLAQAWLDQVYRRTGAKMATTYMVPGNHDVDRAFVSDGLPLWSAHLAVRGSKEPEIWHNQIKKQLVDDPLHSLIAPLRGYNAFAQGYDCLTTEKELAWSKVFVKPLDDGSVVRLHGLNSALISDAGDTPGALLLSDFQTQNLERTPGVVNVVLCHHPPEWLMDKTSIKDTLKDFVPLALFGHEHTTGVASEKKFVRLFAGAVHPSRRDPGHWVPTYHIVQLSVDAEERKRELVIRIHTREYSASRGHRFHTRYNDEDQPIDEHRIPLPAWTLPATAPAPEASTGEVPDVSSPIVPATASSTPTPSDVAKRELLGHFFRLGSPLRYAAAIEADLLRDGDDSLPPQVMWTEVFSRASAENKLRSFWNAVARISPALQDTPNPFA